MTEGPKRKRPLTIVSNSEVGYARECLSKWGFVYGEGLKTIIEPKPLLQGRVAHAGWGAGYETLQGVPVLEARRDPQGTLEEMLEAAQAAAKAEYDEHLRDRLAKVSIEQMDELAKEAEETMALEAWMVRHFFEATKDDIGRMVPVAVEHPFTIAIPDRAGRRTHLKLTSLGIDLVSFDTETGHLSVDEHKTMTATVDNIDRRLEMDPQTTGYVHALRYLTSLKGKTHADSLWPALEAASSMHGLHLYGPSMNTGLIRFNVQRKKIPGVPKTNLDGTISVADIDTLPELYEAALATQTDFATWGAKKRDQAKAAETWAKLMEKQARVLENLQAKGDSFFLRREYHRTDLEVERWREEMWIDAARIRDARRDPKLRTRNPGNCTMPWSMRCRFHTLCLDPGNEEIRAREFTTREQRAQEARKREAAAKAAAEKETLGW